MKDEAEKLWVKLEQATADRDRLRRERDALQAAAQNVLRTLSDHVLNKNINMRDAIMNLALVLNRLEVDRGNRVAPKGV